MQLFFCFEIELLNQIGFTICPVDDVVAADHPSNLATTLGNGIASLLVNPPFNECSDPTVGIWVAGGPDKGLHTADGAVSGEHIEKLVFSEVGELVEAQSANLASLIIVQLIVAANVFEQHP